MHPRLTPLVPLFGCAALLVACGDGSPAAQEAAPPPAIPTPIPPSASAPAAPEAKPAAPAFKSGAPVVGADGSQIGVVQTATEGRSGELMVVVKIDGKMVTTPQSTLTLRPDGTAVSARSREELLAAAGAPPG